MLTQESAHRKDIRSAEKAGGSWPGVLQHRHFAFIAATIKAMPDHAPSLRAQKRSTALAFADACAGTNPRFDRARFLLACGAIAANLNPTR